MPPRETLCSSITKIIDTVKILQQPRLSVSWAPQPRCVCHIGASKTTAALYSGVVSFFLRNAIAWASPRQRFDLVLTNLAGFAFTAAKIHVMSDGTPCRSLVDVEDVYQAIL